MTDLERLLTKALIEPVIAIDLSDDDDIDPDVATDLLEPVAALLQASPEQIRAALVALIIQSGNEEIDPARRRRALDVADAMGLR
jgi:hypothetical protein